MGQALLVVGSSGLLLTAGGCPAYGAPGGPFVPPAGGSTAVGGASPVDAASGGVPSLGGASCKADADEAEQSPCSSTTVQCGDICVSPDNPEYGCGDPACIDCGYPEVNVSCDAGACIFTSCESYFADCDGDPSNGCEAYTTSDPLHCGACNHACEGEACFSGTCVASVLAVGQGVVTDLALDVDTVYFSNDSTISRVPKAGGSVSVLAADLAQPGALAVDDQNVYFTTDTAVMKVDKKGGQAVVLASQQDPLWDLAIDSDFVYWTTHHDCGEVKRVPKNGTQRETLVVDAAKPRTLAVDGSFVYWTTFDGKSIRKLDKGGAGIPVALVSGQHAAHNLVVDAEGLYFSAGSSDVASLALTGGTPLTHSAKLNATNITVDLEFVYWLAGGRILRAPKLGGAVSARAWSGTSGIVSSGLGLDETHVYFADEDRILRAPK